MGFSSYEQQKAAFLNMNGGTHRRHGRRVVRVRKTQPKIHIVGARKFYDIEQRLTTDLIPAKGLIDYKTNEIFINKDAIRSVPDLAHTEKHEMGHYFYGPSEALAEKYARGQLPKQPEPYKMPAASLLRAENPKGIPEETIMAAPTDAKNYKFRVENHVIGAGTRVAIAKELPDNVDLRLENVVDERGEHVVVHVKGEESDVEDYRNKVEYLKKANKLGKAADYEITRIEEDTIQNIDTERTFNKLECEQMSTFVDTSIELRDTTKNGFAGLSQDIKNLPAEIAKAIKSN
jgi:hypothetical protein